MSRERPLTFDKDRVTGRLDLDGRSPSDLSRNAASTLHLRTVQRMLKSGTGPSTKVLRLLKAAGFAIDEIPALIRTPTTPRPGSFGPIRLQMLESLLFAGQLGRVRLEAQSLRATDKDADLADYLDAEIAKWVGDFATAKSLFATLTESANPQLRQFATAGLIRIATQQGQFDDQTTRALVSSLDASLKLGNRSASPFASLVLAFKAWASERNASLPTALRGLQQAFDLARRGPSRIEPVQRLIDRASMLRRRHADPGEHPQTEESRAVDAEAAYVEAYAHAFACNSLVYMASSLNGLARITEQQATMAEQNGDTAKRTEKLDESSRLLQVAVGLAETSEHAVIIATTTGCLAIVRRRQKRFDEAVTLSGHSIALEERMGRGREAAVDRENIVLAKAKESKAVERS